MFGNFETLLGRPRCRNWIPLATQQLRLRHLIQIIGYNIKVHGGSFYYTLHLTTMSAPFYTSEKLESANPKWAELDVSILQNSSSSGVVLRVWHRTLPETPDKIILTWAIYFSGLVYLGTKLSEIQPVSFNDNAVIFQLNGGYFTNMCCVRTDSPKPLPFIDNLNVLSDGESTKITRTANVKCAKSDLRLSYNVKKLQRLHSLQQSIKNKSLDAQALREKISAKCGLLETAEDCEYTETAPVQTHQNAPHLLSMNSLNKLLNKQDQPTKVERQEIAKLKKIIESAKFRTKLLSQERDRKLANLRYLSQQCNTLIDINEDKNTELMARYRQLSREIEKLREWRRSQADIRELFVHTLAQLNLRRKQLINQLLLIYPIEKLSNEKYTISNVHLPDSESLQMVPESNLSVALGYVGHLAVMCSTFLQVPLRYPVVHFGSRSGIIDHITFSIPDKEREFPLYTRRKDRLQFHYAVYLLNKNIAQLRWYYNLPTQDLRATLPNLLSLLQGNSDYRYDRLESGISSRFLTSMTDLRSEPIPSQRKLSLFTDPSPSLMSSIDKMLDSVQLSSSYEQLLNNGTKVEGSHHTTPARKISKNFNDSGPGLSQILSSGNYFKIMANSSPQRFKLGGGDEVDSHKNEKQNSSNCDTSDKKSENVMTSSCVDCNIEQGLNILETGNGVVCTSQNEHSVEAEANGRTDSLDISNKLLRRVSRSVGSYTDDDKSTLGNSNLDMGSDPVLATSLDKPEENTSDQSLPNSLGDSRKEFLQHWFDNSPALVCSEENLCQDEPLASCSQEKVPTDQAEDSARHTLTDRTDALVENSTFHLVRPKH